MGKIAEQGFAPDEDLLLSRRYYCPILPDDFLGQEEARVESMPSSNIRIYGAFYENISKAESLRRVDSDIES